MPTLLSAKHHLEGHISAIYALCTDAEACYSVGGDGWLVRWPKDNPDPGTLIAKAEAQFYSVARTDTGFVAGDMNGGVHWLSTQPEVPHLHIAHHKKGCFGLLSLGDYLYSCGGDGVLTRWQTKTRRSLESLQLSTKNLRALAYDAHTQTLAVGASDGNIYLLDERTLAVKQTLLAAHRFSAFSLAFSPDGQWLLSGGRDAMMRAWEVGDDYSLAWSQPAHLYTVNSIVFSPDGQLVATASRDRTVRLWDATTLALQSTLQAARNLGHRHSVNSLVWLDNQTLVSAGDDRQVVFWDRVN
jgi:WD40 repeat protein